MLSILVCALLIFQATEAGCPFDSKNRNPKEIVGGYEKDGMCFTYVKTDWSVLKKSKQWVETSVKLQQQCERFKGGYLVDYWNAVDIYWGKEALNGITWKTFLKGWFIYGSYVKNDYLYKLAYWRYIIVLDAHFGSPGGIKRQSYEWMLESQFWAYNKLDGYRDTPGFLTHLSLWWPNYKFSLSQSSANTPLCATVTISNKNKENELHRQCAAVAHLTGDEESVMECRHKPYTDCKHHIKHSCHYSEKEKKWYDRFQNNIFQEEPYGKPCPKWTYSSIGAKSCEKSCLGDWTEWTGYPTLKCGTVKLYSYSTALRNMKPCYNDADDCCMRMRNIQYEDACEDFAFNTTINLKKDGCKHNMTTMRDTFNHLKCNCSNKYAGVQCEIDLCLDKCKNSATCIPYGEKSMCLCPLGFQGDMCEIKSDKCGKTGVCENGGTCVPTSAQAGAYCKCPNDFGGETCAHKAEKCDEETCNKNGACHDLKEKYTVFCECNPDFTGDRCESKIEKPFSLSDVTNEHVSKIIVVVLILLSLFVFCTGGAVVHRRRRRRRRGRIGSSVADTSSFYSTFSTAFSKMQGKRPGAKKTQDLSKTKGFTALAKGGSVATGPAPIASTIKK